MTDHEIAEKARKIGSIEWVILESGIMNLRGSQEIRDDLLIKFKALRDAVLSEPEKVCPYGIVPQNEVGTTEYCLKVCQPYIIPPCDWGG